jgi:hypothetical protein
MNIMKLRSLVFAAFLALPLASFAQVEFSVGWAPPPLPVYEQPACPVAGYIWTPGYWGWDDYYYDYYWVPGVWVPPPRVGLLWTPGWWGWNNGAYAFNQGYWGPHVGFYGGVNYGYGYTGNGYWGGRWSGNNFQYNTAVTHVNKTVINNTYVNNSFAKNVNANRTSFNGGNGGIKAEANAEQRAAMANAKKEGPTSQQLERQKLASKDQNLRASVNKGKPNQEAIKSFNKTEGAGQGKGPERLEAAGGAAGAGNAEHKPGKLGGEHKVQGAGMNAEQGQGAGLAGERHGANKHGQNVGNSQYVGQGNQAKMHSGKPGKNGGPANGPHAMNQQMGPQHHQKQMGPQQMGGKHQQQMGMGGQHQQKQMGGGKYPQMGGGGGNRPQPKGQQQQGKKKPDRP